VFIDEAVFTSKLMSSSVWRHKNNCGNFLVKNKSSFVAIAVVSAIDTRGNLVAIECAETSINKPEVKKLLA
jgi:hypothetical protein